LTNRTVAVAVALASFALLGMGEPAGPRSYHVAKTGSDANPGTASAPFKTIQRAVGMVAPGDTVLVHAGTYPEVVTIRKSGTATARIRLLGAGDGEVVINPSLPTVSCESESAARDRAIQFLEGPDYWTVRRLTIVGGIFISGGNTADLDRHIPDRTLPGRGSYDPAASATLLEGLGVDAADGIRIAENKITRRGILTNAARWGRVRANEVYNIDCGTGAGIWINRFSDFWKVHDNFVHHIPPSLHHPMSEGIRHGSSSSYNRVENNLVEDLAGNGRGITTDVRASWNVIRNNVVRRTKQGINEQTGGWGNQWLGNLLEDQREYGFNVDGKDKYLTVPDAGVPAMTVAKCNVSVRPGLAGLSVGALQHGVFELNAFPTVDLAKALVTYWVPAGNTWEGEAVLPPLTPTQKYCTSTPKPRRSPVSTSRPEAGE